MTVKVVFGTIIGYRLNTSPICTRDFGLFGPSLSNKRVSQKLVQCVQETWDQRTLIVVDVTVSNYINDKLIQYFVHVLPRDILYFKGNFLVKKKF